MSESLRLFVIEDDPDSALLIRRHLERADHTVTPCRSGADALIVLGHTAFDLIVLGPRLPDMGGLDFLHNLARRASPCRCCSSRTTRTPRQPAASSAPAPSITSSRTRP